MENQQEQKATEEQGAAASQPSDARSVKAAEAERTRQRQALEMQRERVLAERTSSPHRRSALELALADIEERLAEFGWSLHLNP